MLTDGAPGPLPRGRHSLTREEVSASQRMRMMLGMADAMVEKGFVGTSVADVLARAGVSRETFYQQFDSKLDCFLCAFDAARDILFAQLLDGLEPDDGTPLERFDRLFTGYLEALAAQPAFARLFLVEVVAAGPAAVERRMAVQRRIVEVLVEVLGVDGERGHFACEVLVAAVSSMVAGPLMAQDLDALRALREPVLDLVGHALSR